MRKKDMFTAVLAILSTLLLYSNTDLLLRFAEHHSAGTVALRTLFAAAFSSITVLLIAIYPKQAIFIISGLLDGTALFLELYPFRDDRAFRVAATFYFAAYTAFIVITSGLVSQYEAQKEEETKEKEAEALLVELQQLQNERTSVRNALNRLKDETKRQEKEKLLRAIEQRIAIIEKQLPA